MKNFKFLILFLMVLLSFCFSLGCSGNQNDPADDTTPPTSEETIQPGTGEENTTPSQPENNDPSLLTFENIVFNGETYTYDGTKKSIFVSGTLPTNATVTYQNNEGTNAGTYNASATLTCEGYNTKTLTATLKINKASYNMSNIKWDYTSPFNYSGQVNTVLLNETELPDGVSLKSYTGNSGTNAGDYTANATFNYDTLNYNAPTIQSLNWKILKVDISGIEFDDETFEYDSLEHSLSLIGNVPNGAIVKYYHNSEEIDSPSFTQVGTYEITVTISSPNHNTFTQTSVLTIKSTEEKLYSVYYDGKIYFQNNLDDNRLYYYENNELEKVNNDKVSYMIANNNSIFYFSSSLLNSSIKQLNDTATTLYSTSGEYLATDGTYIYFAINNLLLNTDKNGIYKLPIQQADTTLAQRICVDKAAYLTVVNGYVYYSNLSNSKKLCKVSVNANNATGTLLWDEAVSDIIADSNSLYFNSSATALLGKAVRKYVISSNTCIKLTTDSGKYLTKIGNYIYYINNDLLTSELFGDGIYRVSANTSSDSILPGEKVISVQGDNGYSSLSSDGTNLYYYKLANKHFYKYNISSQTETDLMADFVVENNSLLTGGAYIAEYNGEIYYANINDYGYLYKYNLTTKLNVKVLEDAVSGVYFYNGYMYYSTYVLVNYALWRMDLQTNETTKISTSRCEKLIFDNDTIYFIKVGGVYNNYIYSMNLDGSNPQKLFDTTLWINDFYKVGDNLYCAANTMLGNDALYVYSISNGTNQKCSFETEAFTVDNNGKVYFYDINDNKLCCYNGSSVSTLVSNVKINDLIIHNGKLYYSSSSTQFNGLYAYDLSTKTNTLISSQNAHALSIINGKIFFMQTAINYTADTPINSTTNNNTGKLCCLDGSSIKVLAG